MSVDFSKPEIDAYVALGNALGGKVVDPKYTLDPIRSESELRAAVRAIYPDHGHHLPRWLGFYIAKWRREKAGREPGAVSGDTPVLDAAQDAVPERKGGGD